MSFIEPIAICTRPLSSGRRRTVAFWFNRLYKTVMPTSNCVTTPSSVPIDAIGGAGALLAKCIKKAELIAYEDLGAEALRKLYVEDMPLVVIIDSEGNNLYEEGRAEYLAEHKAHEAEKNA